MNTINNTTIETKVQLPVFMLDLTGELVDTEKRTGERSCDGRFLKKHVSMKKATVKRFLDDDDE